MLITQTGPTCFLCSVIVLIIKTGLLEEELRFATTYGDRKTLVSLVTNFIIKKKKSDFLFKSKTVSAFFGNEFLQMLQKLSDGQQGDYFKASKILHVFFTYANVPLKQVNNNVQMVDQGYNLLYMQTSLLSQNLLLQELLNEPKLVPIASRIVGGIIKFEDHKQKIGHVVSFHFCEDGSKKKKVLMCNTWGEKCTDNILLDMALVSKFHLISGIYFLVKPALQTVEHPTSYNINISLLSIILGMTAAVKLIV